jgi:hypothetical protein
VLLNAMKVSGGAGLVVVVVVVVASLAPATAACGYVGRR